MIEKKSPDWGRIEFEYRRNISSLREIAAPHGITEGSIRKRAAKYKWVRDINDVVQAKARRISAKKAAGEKAKTESQLIEITADTVASVMMEHKGDLKGMRSACSGMLAELQTQGTLSADNLRVMAESMAMLADGQSMEPNEIEKVVNTFRKLLGLSGRADTLKKLVDAHVKLIEAERVVHGITGEVREDGDIASALRALANGQA